LAQSKISFHLKFKWCRLDYR